MGRAEQLNGRIVFAPIQPLMNWCPDAGSIAGGHGPGFVPYVPDVWSIARVNPCNGDTRAGGRCGPKTKQEGLEYPRCFSVRGGSVFCARASNAPSWPRSGEVMGQGEEPGQSCERRPPLACANRTSVSDDLRRGEPWLVSWIGSYMTRRSWITLQRIVSEVLLVRRRNVWIHTYRRAALSSIDRGSMGL